MKSIIHCFVYNSKLSSQLNFDVHSICNILTVSSSYLGDVIDSYMLSKSFFLIIEY